MARTLQELETVKVGDMTKEERRLIFRAACAKLERELSQPHVQAAMAEILNTPTPEG